MTDRRTLLTGIFFVVLAPSGLVGCGASDPVIREESISNPALRHADATRSCCAGTVYRARATGYYPSPDAMEGGFRDRKGKKLRTLQDYIDGRVDYVSVAMDAKALPYGARICIPELNARYGESIPFRVVDTGAAFRSKGTSRIDICTRSHADAIQKSLNRPLEIVACDGYANLGQD